LETPAAVARMPARYRMRYRAGMDERSTQPAEYWTPERCYITEYLNRASLPSVSVASARVEPGVTTALHVVGVDEWYLIRSGHGLMQVGDREPWAVGPGDTVRIPRDSAQRITNTGTDDLLFFCVCVPRFTPGTYRVLE
jgi:mannose-6-phosphate isomerase-like protein (cupin superfamily)